MKCSLCGLEFDIKDAASACSGCLLTRSCELVKCPNCGFEMAPDPKWIKSLKKRRRKKDAINR